MRRQRKLEQSIDRIVGVAKARVLATTESKKPKFRILLFAIAAVAFAGVMLHFASLLKVSIEHRWRTICETGRPTKKRANETPYFLSQQKRAVTRADRMAGH